MSPPMPDQPAVAPMNDVAVPSPAAVPPPRSPGRSVRSKRLRCFRSRPGLSASRVPARSDALGAELLAVLAQRQPAVVLHEEAAGADEFVGLLGDHADGEFLTGEVGVG